MPDLSCNIFLRRLFPIKWLVHFNAYSRIRNFERHNSLVLCRTMFFYNLLWYLCLLIIVLNNQELYFVIFQHARFSTNTSFREDYSQMSGWFISTLTQELEILSAAFLLTCVVQCFIMVTFWLGSSCEKARRSWGKKVLLWKLDLMWKGVQRNPPINGKIVSGINDNIFTLSMMLNITFTLHCS